MALVIRAATLALSSQEATDRHEYRVQVCCDGEPWLDVEGSDGTAWTGVAELRGTAQFLWHGNGGGHYAGESSSGEVSASTIEFRVHARPAGSNDSWLLGAVSESLTTLRNNVYNDLRVRGVAAGDSNSAGAGDGNSPVMGSLIVKVRAVAALPEAKATEPPPAALRPAAASTPPPAVALSLSTSELAALRQRVEAEEAEAATKAAECAELEARRDDIRRQASGLTEELEAAKRALQGGKLGDLKAARLRVLRETQRDVEFQLDTTHRMLAAVLDEKESLDHRFQAKFAAAVRLQYN